MGADNDPTDFVLMLMDYQKAMCRPTGPIGRSGLAEEVSRRSVLQRAAHVLDTFRSQGWPVVHVRVAFDSHYMRMTSASPRFAQFRERQMMLEDAEETEICPEVEPAPAEPVIDKGCVNPFVGTHLGPWLLRRRIHHLLLGGVATNHVVESTARYAADCGYRVTVLPDLCASNTSDLHEFSVSHILPAYGDVTDSDTTLWELESTSADR